MNATERCEVVELPSPPPVNATERCEVVELPSPPSPMESMTFHFPPGGLFSFYVGVGGEVEVWSPDQKQVFKGPTKVTVTIPKREVT